MTTGSRHGGLGWHHSRGRAGVVSAAPGQVPSDGDQAEPDEDDGGVVHGAGIDDGDGGRHAEERDGEQRPGYREVSTGETRDGPAC